MEKGVLNRSHTTNLPGYRHTQSLYKARSASNTLPNVPLGTEILGGGRDAKGPRFCAESQISEQLLVHNAQSPVTAPEADKSKG